MEEASPIPLIVRTDLRRLLSSGKPKDPKRFVISTVLVIFFTLPFALFAVTGGAALTLVDDPLLPVRGVFVFAAVSSFILSLLLFVNFNSDTQELSFLILTPAKRWQIIVAKLVSTSFTLGVFYLVMFFLFLINFSAGTDMLYLFTGTLAFVLTLSVSFVLANMCSLLILRFLNTASNKRTLKVVGLLVIVTMIFGMRWVMTASVRYLGFTKWVPPAYGADLMLMKFPQMLVLAGYLLLIPLGIFLTVKASRRFWSFSGSAESVERRTAGGPSLGFEEPTFLVAQKEARAMWREPEVMIRVAMLFVFLALWPLLNLVLSEAYSLWTIPVFLVMEGVMIALVINPNSLGTEANTLWMLKTSPLRAYDMFFGKWFIAALSVGVMFYLFLIFYVSVGWIDPLPGLMLAVLIFEIALFIPGMAIGIGFNFPDFQRAKKNRPGISTIGALYLVAMLVFLPAMISMTYSMVAADTVYDILFWNALGLGITGAVGAVVTFKLYRSMENIYEDLETVDGASFLT